MPIKITKEYLDKVIFSRRDLATILKEFYDKIKDKAEKEDRWLQTELLRFLGNKIHPK